MTSAHYRPLWHVISIYRIDVNSLVYSYMPFNTPFYRCTNAQMQGIVGVGRGA